MTFQCQQKPCEECRVPSDCIVWQCPHCHCWRWIGEWEGYSDVAACPECDAIVKYAELIEPNPVERLCRWMVLAAAENETKPQLELFV